MDSGIISIIISGFSLITAVSSTLITACLNNRHAARMHKIEFYEKRKYEVIENYLKNVGKVIFYPEEESVKDLSEWISEIYMYMPSEYWNGIDEINKIILEISKDHFHYPHREEAKKKYLDFCKSVSSINRKQSVTKIK